MEAVCLRITRGMDLKQEIIKAARESGIKCGAVLCAVGCVSRARLRCADGKTIIGIDEPCEIVSMTGTVSSERCHLHVSLAKSDLTVIGGHLVDGCIVNTTCELIIGIVDGYRIEKVFDCDTGYDELAFIKE